MATQSEGIQKLLEAEKAAQKEVDVARKGKIRRNPEIYKKNL